MKIKANCSFSSSSISMYKGEVKECDNQVMLQDLLQAGYVEEVKNTNSKKKGKGGQGEGKGDR